MDIERKDTSSHKLTALRETLGKDTKSIKGFINKFNNDWVMNFSGILAYNLLTAMLPIAIALLGIIGLVMGGNDVLYQSIKKQTAGIAGLRDAIVLAHTQLSKDASILVIIAILLAIFGGSRLFVTLEGILDILYRVRPRPLIRQNLIAIAMLLLFIVLIPIMIFASAAPSFVFSLLGNTPLKSIPVLNSIVGSNPITLTIGSILGSLIVAFILFEAIYFIVPNQHISWRNSWRGAVFAAVLLELFLVAFPFYVGRFLGGYAGQIGFAVILLLFFYYFAVILLLGAEFNAYYSEAVQPLPNDMVTFVSTIGGKLNRDIPTTEAPAHQNAKPTDEADKRHVIDDRKRVIDQPDKKRVINNRKQVVDELQ